MPPTQDAVLMWSSIFAPGGTFRNYLGQLKKGCILAGGNIERYTLAVRTASDGLRNAKRGHFAFPNFLLIRDIFAIISTLGMGEDVRATNFHRLPFSLIIPPDELQLRRAFADDPIAEFVTQNEKSLIGARPFG